MQPKCSVRASDSDTMTNVEIKCGSEHRGNYIAAQKNLLVISAVSHGCRERSSLCCSGQTGRPNAAAESRAFHSVFFSAEAKDFSVRASHHRQPTVRSTCSAGRAY